MSGIRAGTRLQQLQDLRRQITIRIEYARRNALPAGHLLDLAAAVDDEIRAEGGTPPPPAGFVVVRRRRRPETRPRAPHTSDLLMAQLGVTTPVVRAWAVENGLLRPGRRGRICAAVVEAYAIHHQLDQITRKAGTTP